VHEKAILRILPKVMTIFSRDPNFTEGYWNHTEAADFIRPGLKGFVDLILDLVGPVRISL